MLLSAYWLGRNGHIHREFDAAGLGVSWCLVPMALLLFLCWVLRLRGLVLPHNHHFIPYHPVVPALLTAEWRVPSVFRNRSKQKEIRSSEYHSGIRN
uniref:Uncharacterized protein n=1 Tax=Arundo donax TaxID=35708 RepID=A0A0A9G6C6_ARUDO